MFTCNFIMHKLVYISSFALNVKTYPLFYTVYTDDEVWIIVN